MTGDIQALFAKLRSELERAAKQNGSEPHEIASMQAGLAIGEIVVTDLHRIADAAEALASAQ